MPFKYSLNWFSNQYLAPSCCSLLAVVVLAAFMFAGVVVVAERLECRPTNLQVVGSSPVSCQALFS